MAKHLPGEAEAYKKHVKSEKWVAKMAFLMQAFMDGHALNDRLLRRAEGRCRVGVHGCYSVIVLLVLPSLCCQCG